MPPPETKRQKRVEEAPVNRQPEACFDFSTRVKTEPREPEDVPQDARQNAVTDTQEGASPSGTFMEDAGHELQNMLEGIKGDIKKAFQAKIKKFWMDTKAFRENIIHIIGQAVENQQEEWQEVFLKYSEQFHTLLHALDMDAKKTKEQEEKLLILLYEQRIHYYKTRAAHKQRLTTFLHMYNNFSKSMEDLGEKHECFFADKDSELKQEISEL